MFMIFKSAVLILFASVAASASAVGIDFEELANVGPDVTVYGNLNSKGFRFISTPDSVVASWASDSPFYTGSTAIFVGAFSWMSMTSLTNTPFTVESVDLADINLVSGTHEVRAIGIRADNSGVNQVLPMNSGATMSTFNLTGFTDLKYFYLEDGVTANFQVDNIMVAGVPEPATLSAIGVGVIAFMRKRRRA